VRSPVIVTNTASVTEADLLVGRLRSQGIDAVARTNLDRTTYAGLGGAVVMVGSDQRMEAELELILLTSGEVIDDAPAFDDEPALDDEAAIQQECGSHQSIGQRSWVRVFGYVALAAMAVGTVVPSAAVIWNAVLG
jgi:hypothetical protein